MLNQEIAKQTMKQMKIPEKYAQIALENHIKKVILKQTNIDKITKYTLQELEKINHSDNQSTVNNSNPTQKIISDDWLNSFEKEAKYKSTEEMQIMFGRILAGEIKQPSSFSIKAIKTLGELDPKVARLFQKLCSCALFVRPPISKYITIIATTLSLGGSPGANALRKFGLAFSELNLLIEYGLIISELNSIYDYKICVWDKDKSIPHSIEKENLIFHEKQNIKEKEIMVPFYHQNQFWMLKPINGYNKNTSLPISGIVFSQVGQELSHIVDIEPSEEYTQELRNFFLTKKLEMTHYPNK